MLTVSTDVGCSFCILSTTFTFNFTYILSHLKTYKPTGLNLCYCLSNTPCETKMVQMNVFYYNLFHIQSYSIPVKAVKLLICIFFSCEFFVQFGF